MRFFFFLAYLAVVLLARNNWTTYRVDDKTGVCTDGTLASVRVWINPIPATTWVIEIGPGSEGLGFCITEATCAMFGAKNGTTPSPKPIPPPEPIYGPESINGQNCTTNPDFCNANQAQVSMCDQSLGVGNNVFTDAHGTVMHFKGRAMLSASIKKLGILGLASAEKVLLFGVSTGGTYVFLNADFLHDEIKSVASGLKVFKAMPVDGLHARLKWPIFCEERHRKPHCKGKIVKTWYDSGLKTIANLSKAVLHPQCVAAQPSADYTYQCLYGNETFPYITTPIFAVQTMISVFDAQCINEGIPVHAKVQVGCSHDSSQYHSLRNCVQYIDQCSKGVIRDWWAPGQETYLKAYTATKAHVKAGNGGFFHQCYTGAYFLSSFGTTNRAKVPRSYSGMWNQISVGGMTIQEAISVWWNGDDTKPGPWLADDLWDPEGVPPTNDEIRSNSSAPKVPWYNSRYYTNPSCRGYPWY